MALGAAAGILGGLGSAAGGIAGLFQDDDASDLLYEGMQLLKAVQDPTFDMRSLTPPQLEFISQVDPVLYDAVVPDDVKLMAESSFRGQQSEALGGLQAIAREGVPMADRLSAEAAMDSAAREARRGQEAIVSDLGSRGRLGGGMELQARMAGEQQMSDLYGRQGRALAQDALARKMGALESSGQLAGQARGQDQSREATNADMINRFNQYVASQQTDAARDNAAAQMQARVANAEGRQRISDINKNMEYSGALDNLTRQNAARMALADFQARKAGSVAEGYGGLADIATSQSAASAGGMREGLAGLGTALGGMYDYYNPSKEPKKQTIELKF